MMMTEMNRCGSEQGAAELKFCPFEDRADNSCSASLSGFYVGAERRQTFCSTENYDACPFFLSRVIRKKY